MVTIQQPSTKYNILEYILQHSQVKTSELAAILDISPQAVRRHLKDLEAEELVLYSSTVGDGVGRPQHIYKLSYKGRERLSQEVSNGSGDFAVSLLDTVVDTIGQERVGSILKKQWGRKAEEYRNHLGDASSKDRVAALVKLRRDEGYMAEFYPVDSSKTQMDEAGSHFLFVEHNCAISNVAKSFPSICEYELEMLATILPDFTVERTQCIINGGHRCGYMLQTKGQKKRKKEVK